LNYDPQLSTGMLQVNELTVLCYIQYPGRKQQNKKKW